MAVDTAVGHEEAMKQRRQIPQQHGAGAGGNAVGSGGGGFKKMKKRGPCNIL